MVEQRKTDRVEMTGARSVGGVAKGAGAQKAGRGGLGRLGGTVGERGLEVLL